MKFEGVCKKFFWFGKLGKKIYGGESHDFYVLLLYQSISLN